jgi:hypothetical protein
MAEAAVLCHVVGLDARRAAEHLRQYERWRGLEFLPAAAPRIRTRLVDQREHALADRAPSTAAGGASGAPRTTQARPSCRDAELAISGIRDVLAAAAGESLADCGVAVASGFEHGRLHGAIA